jgi:hypothetical protein
MARLAELNRQADQQQKAQEIKTHWVKNSQVDVMVWDICFCYYCLLAVKIVTDIFARIQITFMPNNAKNPSACLPNNVPNT